MKISGSVRAEGFLLLAAFLPEVLSDLVDEELIYRGVLSHLSLPGRALETVVDLPNIVKVVVPELKGRALEDELRDELHVHVHLRGHLHPGPVYGNRSVLDNEVLVVQYHLFRVRLDLIAIVSHSLLLRNRAGVDED